MQEQSSTRPTQPDPELADSKLSDSKHHDPEEMLDDALAEPVLSGESRIPEAQVVAAAFLVLAVGAAAHINAWLPLRVEPAALVVHLASALAVFAIARRVLTARTEVPAMAAGMLFAVHPMAAAAIQGGDLRVLTATLLALLSIALTLAASNASLPTPDFRRIALALILYTAAALLYPPLIALALVLPLLHWVRVPKPAHAALRTVTAAYALLFVSLLVAAPYLTVVDLNGGLAAGLFLKTSALLLGLTPYSVWHPVPAAAEGWIATLLPVSLAVVAIAILVRSRSALGPALAFVLLLAASTAWTLPLDAVPLEPALYPALAGIALALGAVATAAGSMAPLRPVAAVAAAVLLVYAGVSTYARHGLSVEPLAPLRAVVDIYPGEAAPRLILAEALYQQGNEALGVGALARGEAPVVLRAGDARSHYQAALRYTGEVVDYFGLSAEAMYLQGKILMGLGRSEEAAEDLFIALRLAPWRTDITHALAESYAAQQDDQAVLKAAEYYESAVRRDPGDERLTASLARHLERSGLLGRLARLDDGLIPPDQRDRVRAMREQDHEVLQLFQGDAFNPAALTALAEARLDRAQTQQALYALHEALRGDPAHTAAWRILADWSVEAGDHAAFVAEYAGIPAAPPTAWEERAVNYASAGHWEAARAFLRNSLPEDAAHGAYLLRVADLAIATGLLERAEEALAAAADAGADEDALADRRRRLERRAQ